MSPSDIDFSGQERVSLADENGVKTIVTETIAGLWDLVNNLTRLEASTKDRHPARHRLSDPAGCNRSQDEGGHIRECDP